MHTPAAGQASLRRPAAHIPHVGRGPTPNEQAESRSATRGQWPSPDGVKLCPLRVRHLHLRGVPAAHRGWAREGLLLVLVVAAALFGLDDEERVSLLDVLVHWEWGSPVGSVLGVYGCLATEVWHRSRDESVWVQGASSTSLQQER